MNGTEYPIYRSLVGSEMCIRDRWPVLPGHPPGRANLHGGYAGNGRLDRSKLANF